MIIRSLKLLSAPLCAAAAFAALSGIGRAEELAPFAGRTVVLDDVRGTVYYAPNGADFVVVATLDSDGRPVRFVTTLQPGQTTKISTPGSVGQAETAIEFPHDGDRLFVDEHRVPSGPAHWFPESTDGKALARDAGHEGEIVQRSIVLGARCGRRRLGRGARPGGQRR